jgi:hypothetical protein
VQPNRHILLPFYRLKFFKQDNLLSRRLLIDAVSRKPLEALDFLRKEAFGSNKKGAFHTLGKLQGFVT